MMILPSRRSRQGQMAGLLFVLFAGPAAAADFQVENVKLDLGRFVLTIPKLDVKGTPLERDAFLALFQGGGSESASARMSRLSAAELSAPTLLMEQSLGGQKQTTTYRDIRLSDIREGRIARGESSSGTIQVEDSATGPMSGEIKRTRFDLLDLTHIARVFGEKAAPGSDPQMQTVYGRFEQDGYEFDLGQVGKMTFGKSVFRNFKAKLGPEPLGDVFSRFGRLSEEAEKASSDINSKEDPKLTNARQKELLATTLAMFDAFDIGSGEMRDTAMSIAEPPKPGVKAEMIDMRFSRIAFGEDAPEKSGLSLEGLQFGGSASKGTLAAFSYSGFSMAPVLQQFKAAIADPAFDADAVDFRKFIPQLGTVRVSGLQIEVPQAARRGQPVRPGQPPIKIGIGTFEIKAGEQLNGIPTALTLTLDRLTTPVVESPTAPSARDLLAMGYQTLDLSAKVDLAWQAASNELSIRSLSLGGVGMVQIDATGQLGNVTKEAFSSDMALAQVALLGATAKGLDIRLRNLGLVEKLIENEARKSKRKVEDVRKEYATIATIGLAAILGPSEGAKTLANAISRFVAKPGTLAVSATARAPGGIGLADVITLGDPTEIFDKIDVKASAE